MSKLLEDSSGLYNLDHVASIHPAPVKGDRHDQTKVTAVHTAVATVGGHTHQTSIPWDEASAAAKAYWMPENPAS